MTQEEKELLLKDLCTRLPYRTKIDTGVEGIATLDGTLYEYSRINLECGNDVFLPYLRPMTRMTEEEKFTYEQYCKLIGVNPFGGSIVLLVKFLYSHHLDYNGLLALEAPEEMYM